MDSGDWTAAFVFVRDLGFAEQTKAWPIARLSTGERLRLALARALTMRPRFVLLDEPAGGLTVAEIETLGAIIGVMRDEGIGVLLVEHHTDFVFRVCDRVTVLNLGRVLAHGAPQTVRNDPEVIRVYLGA